MTENMNRREFIGLATASTVGLSVGMAILTDAEPAAAGEPDHRNCKITIQDMSNGNVFSRGQGVNINFDHHWDAPYENLFTDVN